MNLIELQVIVIKFVKLAKNHLPHYRSLSIFPMRSLWEVPEYRLHTFVTKNNCNKKVSKNVWSYEKVADFWLTSAQLIINHTWNPQSRKHNEEHFRWKQVFNSLKFGCQVVGHHWKEIRLWSLIQVPFPQDTNSQSVKHRRIMQFHAIEYRRWGK